MIWLVLYVFSTTSLFANSSSDDDWYTIISSNEEFHYWTSNSGSAPEDWREADFNDENWNIGIGGIGYGDGDDGTIVDACNSVFLRKSFQVNNKANFTAFYFYIDYDDAFVAYLNGTEIARSEGLNAAFPEGSTLSNTQHEAGQPQGYRLSSEVVSSLLKTGMNVLAVQVHNASTNSSDLSSSVWLLANLSTNENQYTEAPAWFEAPFVFTSSNLPIVVINTDNKRTIVDEPKIDADMGIIFNGDGRINHMTDPYNEYNGRIGIELRGNSTQGFPKKPYLLETRDSLGENLNVPLFGWPKENDWILRASYLDHTFMRNGLADYMSRANGWWASRTKLVEVVLNGEYQGIYVMMEKIKQDKGRVDIATLTPDEITIPDITGGYIWEVTGFENNFGESRNLKYPDIDEAAPEQVDYIRHYDDNFRSAMRRSNFTDSTAGYRTWINVPSFVNEIIVQEAMRNSDAYGWSGYFHKDKEEKICAGPVWDFDQSAGNSSYPDNGVVEGWMFSHPQTSNTPFFWSKLMTDPAFAYQVRERWETLRKGPFKTDRLFAYIDSVATLLTEPQTREFSKWNVLGVFIWRETSGYQQRNTYQKEVDYLKSFLQQRWEWMDTELAKYENPYPVDTTTVIDTITIDTTSVVAQIAYRGVKAYPNPAKDRITIRLPELQGNASILLYNSLGSLVHRYDSGDLKNGMLHLSLNDYQPGIYIFRVETDRHQLYTGRFIKLE